MKKQLRSISTVVILMFVALFVSTTSIQFFEASSLRADPRNSRSILASYSTKRGAILTSDGTAIAESTPVDDQYNYQRKYSNGAMYSPVTGYFTIGQGNSGIESAENEELSGQADSSFFQNINAILTGQDVQGDNITTTIDEKVQQAAWDALGDQSGAVVAIQPKTGKILAMVSKPTYDPNTLASHDTTQVIAQYKALVAQSGAPLQNRAIGGDLYAPGSVFKIVVASAALADGYKLTDTLPNPSTLKLPDTATYINNAEGGSCGGGSQVTIALAIQDSCNIPFAELGEKLGYKKIKAMADKYGYGSSIDVPQSSTASQFPQPDSTAQLMLQSFGQGNDRVSPLQIAMTTAGVANGGTVMQPTLIDSIQTSDLKTVQSFSPKTYSSPISSSEADDLTTAMESVVNSGTGTNARIDGVDVAGKTGTAENGTGDPYTLWFTGFAPAKDPQVAVAVVVGNGGGLGQSGVGNTVAAPIAKKVMEAVLNK
jgi:penicillin-binding protein A